MTPDEIRRAALDSIDRQEQLYRVAFFGAVAIEGFFILLFMWLMDFQNRLHVLFFAGTIATYTIIGLGLVALGALGNRNTLRIVRAIDQSSASADRLTLPRSSTGI